MKNTSFLFRASLAIAVGALAFSEFSAQAATKTWSSAIGGNISASTNWSPSGNLTSGDSLVFSNAGGGSIVFDTAVLGGSVGAAGNLGGISFTGTPGAYILDLSSNSFNLSNPNAIAVAATVTNNQTIGSSVGSGTIFISAAASAGTGFFVNSSPSATLVINSNIAKGDSGASNSSIVFGNINGTPPAGTGNIVVNGNISGNMGNGVTKTGTGATTFAGNNTYTGGTNVGSGTLSLTGGISAGAITVYSGQVTPAGTGATGPFFGGTLTESTSGVISGAATLAVNSSLVAGGTSGTATLAGNNTTTGAFTVGSTGSGASTGNPYNPLILGSASLTLSGANNSSANQTITVNPNSRLVLDFSPSGAPTNNILNNVSNATVVNLTGGQLEIIGKSGASNSQTLATTTGATGIVPIANTASQIKFTQNGAASLSLDLKTINRGAGATIDIAFPSTGTVSSTNTATNGLASSGGLAWGTANNGTTLLGASGTALSAYGGWVTGNYTSINNVDVTNGDSISGVTVSTLRFNGGTKTLTNASTTTIGSDTVLVTPGSTAIITGGTIQSGTARELFFINNGNLSVDSAVADSTSGTSALSVASTLGQTGVATFGGNNTVGGVSNITNTTARFTGTNTFTGAVTVGYAATLDLAGTNTLTGGVKLNNGATLKVTGANGLGSSGSPAITVPNQGSVSNLVIAAGGTLNATPSLATTGATNGSILNVILDGSNQAFSSLTVDQKTAVNFFAVSGTPTVTVSGNTTIGNNNSGSVSTFVNAGTGVSLSLGAVTGVVPAAGGNRTNTLFLDGVTGSNQVLGVISNGISGNTTAQTAVTKSGIGTWTLKGNNTYTAATAVNGGALVLDYGTNNNSKISSTGVLTLSGGTLQLKDGSTAQAVASTTFNTGQSAITQNGGTSAVALGVITSTAGAADFTSGVANTTTINGANGLLGGLAKYTVGGADWAVSGASGTNPITALGSYTPLALASGGNNTTNYSLADSNGTPVTGALTLGTLKITTTTAGQSLALGANQLTLGGASGSAGLLFAGANEYTITSTNATGLTAAAGSIILQDWGTGVLNLNIGLKTTVEKYGTGKIVLGTNATGAFGTSILAGTVQVSSDAQLSNSSASALTLSGSYGNGAAFVGNTGSGSFAVPRTISLGAQGGSYIDVVGGNTLTLSGIISGTQNTPANNIVTFGGASAVDATNNAVTSGTIILAGANTYSGGTTFAAGTVNLGVAEMAGASGPLGSAGTLTFTGGTLQYSASNAFDYSSRFSQVANQQFKIDTNSKDVTFAYGLAGAGSSLVKSGAGNLTLTGANAYSGTTIVSAGTLIVSGGGSLNASANITVSNGATLTNNTTTPLAPALLLSEGSSLTGTGSFTPTALTLIADLLGGAFTPVTLGSSLAQSGAIGFALTNVTDGSYPLFTGTTPGGFFSTVSVGGSPLTDLGSGIFSANIGGVNYTFNNSLDTLLVAVPEPATWLLVGIGLTFLLYRKRNRRNDP